MATGHTDLLIGHASMQFSDTVAQKTRDADKIFKRNYAWLTGTEAGESPLRKVLTEAAGDYGYTAHFYKSNFICIKRALITKGTYHKGGRTLIENDRVVGPGHDSNFAAADFYSPKLGRIHILSSHYPTKGTPLAKDPDRRVNLWASKKMATEIGRETVKRGRGSNLVFVGADFNIVDRHADVFFGSPLTTCWDERRYWPNTGHDNIDAIATYDRDGRVKCIDADAFNDRELPLFTDHFLIQAKYRVRHLR